MVGMKMRRIISILTCFAALSFAEVDRGVSLYEKGDYNNAANELRAAVKANPGDARANRYLGLTLIEQSKGSEAEQYIRKSDQIESNSESKLALARLYIDQKKWDQAEKAIEEGGGDEAQYLRGVMYVNKKQNQEAVKELESFLEKKADHAYAHYYLGLAYNGLRKPDKMLTHFEMFLRMRPDAAEARKVRAVMQTGR
jgi:tetratricopeptide (TPR) repeat protein